MPSGYGRDRQGVPLTVCARCRKIELEPILGQQFLPGGGTLTDFALREDLLDDPPLGFLAVAQYETWNMPVIQPGQQTNFSSLLQVTYRPKPRGRLWKTE